MRKPVIYTIAIAIAAIAAASFLGVKAGDIVNSIKYRESRTRTTEAILNRMGSIEIGSTMPDNRFEDLQQRDILLSSLISGRTLLMFFSPDCHNCIDELHHLSDAVGNESEYQRFILISPDDRLDLIQLRDEYDIQCRILWDRDNMYAGSMNIYAQPFNVVIDDSLRVENIIAGPMTVAELRAVATNND